MMINMKYTILENELYHYGIKGQKWGVRRFRNLDGTLTKEGKDRYQLGKEFENERERIEKEEKDRLHKEQPNLSEKEANSIAYRKSFDKISRKYGNTAIDDIKFYKNGSLVGKWIAGIVGGGLTLATVIGIIGAKIFSKSTKKQDNSNDTHLQKLVDKQEEATRSMRR